MVFLFSDFPCRGLWRDLWLLMCREVNDPAAGHAHSGRQCYGHGSHPLASRVPSITEL
jgi:hypothetical protein